MPPSSNSVSAEATIEENLLIAEIARLRGIASAEQAALDAALNDKEKLSSFWLLSKKQLEDLKHSIREKEHVIETLSEEFALELRTYKVKIKQLMLNHNSEIADKQTEGIMSLMDSQTNNILLKHDLDTDKRDQKLLLKESEVSHSELVHTLRLEQDEAITELRLNFEQEARDLQARYDEVMSRLREEAGASTEHDIRLIVRRKEAQAVALMSTHEKAFADIKQYYSEITHSNLDLIKSLKEEVEDMRKKEAGDERVIYSISLENRRMTEPLRKTLEQVKVLREKREKYRKDIERLQSVKAECAVLTDEFAALQWEYDILQQRHLRVVAERDALYGKLTKAIQEVKRQSGFRSLLLDQKLQSTSDEIDRADVLLNELVTSASGLERKEDPRIKQKNEEIEKSQAELALLCQRHDEVVATCLDLLNQHNVPIDELGFEPLLAKDILTK